MRTFKETSLETTSKLKARLSKAYKRGEVDPVEARTIERTIEKLNQQISNLKN